MAKRRKNKEYASPEVEWKKEICEQLGLNVYGEETPKVPKMPKPSHPKTSPLNDIDLNNWKAYDEVITDSLWLMGSRDRSGMHTGELHGNFIPQIPHQALLRYTKQGDTVLDTFLGSGTTLIECKGLGWHRIGIELIPEVVENWG